MTVPVFEISGRPEMHHVEKRWGSELWVCNNDLYCSKRIRIDVGKFTSLHHHEIKDEVIEVVEGSLLLAGTCGPDCHECGGGDAWCLNSEQAHFLEAGQTVRIRPRTRHQLHGLSGVRLAEYSTTHSDHDSYRTTTSSVGFPILRRSV